MNVVKSNMAEVTASAPLFPNCEPITCWRLHRSDAEIRRAYQVQMLRKHRTYIPLQAIKVEGEYQRAA